MSRPLLVVVATAASCAATAFAAHSSGPGTTAQERDVDVSRAAEAQNEPAVAIDPADPRILLPV